MTDSKRCYCFRFGLFWLPFLHGQRRWEGVQGEGWIIGLPTLRYPVSVFARRLNDDFNSITGHWPQMICLSLSHAVFWGEIAGVFPKIPFVLSRAHSTKMLNRSFDFSFTSAIIYTRTKELHTGRNTKLNWNQPNGSQVKSSWVHIKYSIRLILSEVPEMYIDCAGFSLSPSPPKGASPFSRLINVLFA